MEYYIDPVTFVTQKSGFESRYIKNLLGLLDEGATIPFISRYRKEMTGSMDEVQVGQVREMYEQFKEQDIIHERGIQKAYRNLTSPFGNSKKLVKDIGEDHEAIEELKAYLSN